MALITTIPHLQSLEPTSMSLGVKVRVTSVHVQLVGSVYKTPEPSGPRNATEHEARATHTAFPRSPDFVLFRLEEVESGSSAHCHCLPFSAISSAQASREQIHQSRMETRNILFYHTATTPPQVILGNSALRFWGKHLDQINQLWYIIITPWSSCSNICFLCIS